MRSKKKLWKHGDLPYYEKANKRSGQTSGTLKRCMEKEKQK
jgi:hypothetical protein